MYLKRYHDVEISSSGVWRILKRLDMSRLPASQRYKRHERTLEALREAAPGHQVQIDVKFIAPIGGKKKKYYQFTAIDDCTRIRVLRIYDRLNQKTAIQFLDYVLEQAALPGRVDPDRQRVRIPVVVPLARARPRHRPRLHPPATPRLNGKVERSHRIDAEEFYRLLEGVVIDDTELFNDKLQEWEDFYNYHRPHGGLGGQTPYERLRQKTKAPA